MLSPRGFGNRWLLLALCMLSGFGCRNNARDSQCSPSSPDRDTDPACIYAGKGDGPPFVEPTCTEPAGNGAGGNGEGGGGAADGGGGTQAQAPCPTFYDVLDVIADPAKGNCSSTGCHGLATNAASQIFLPIADPQQFYAGLTEAEGSVGRPYVVPDDTSTSENEALESWIGCSLRGDRGGGYPMPPPAGMLRAEDIALVSAWLRCGAKAPESCDAAGGDNACTTCAKEQCCASLVKCNNDAICSPCASCLATQGEPSMCMNECSQENPSVLALFGCSAQFCDAECPGASG